jgi:SAM-dependent methyltransferase
MKAAAKKSRNRTHRKNRTCYGRAFAGVYDHGWAFWGDKMWKFISHRLKRDLPGAFGQKRTWLDLCCGGGSLLRHACKAGFETVGLDCSPHQLQFARRNAPAAALARGDVRDFDLGRQFDVVTCMFDSLNYLTSRRDFVGAITNARRHLAPGGVFIFDMNTYTGLQRHWNDRTSGCCESNYALLMTTHFDDRKAIGTLEITGFVRRGRSRLYERFREVHVERGYHQAEIEAVLQKAGFAFDVLDGNRLSRKVANASRLLYICKLAK